MENDKHKILVVDDNPRNIQLLGNLLPSQNYDIEYALNGPDALELISIEEFDLILLDIMMPKMDGFEVCERIKKDSNKKEIPVIFLTAKTDIDNIQKAFKSGGVDYITKPFNSDELLTRIKTHIDLKISKSKLNDLNMRLEEKVEERTAKLKRSDAILNQINSLVQVCDNKGNITYNSPSFKTVLGFEPQDLLGQGWWIQSTPDKKTANKVRDAIMNNIYYNIPITDEIRYRKIKSKDGKEKLFHWGITKAFDDTFIFVGVDVTEKHEKENQFKTLTETARDAIILTDHNGLIFEWNISSQETFGYSKKEVIGKSVTLLMSEEYRSQYKEGFSETMKTSLKADYRNNIVEGLTKDGQIFPMELSLNYWQSNNNNVYCYFIRDITKRQHEEQIKEIIYNITKYAHDVLSIDKLIPFIKNKLNSVIDTSSFFIELFDDKTQTFKTDPFVLKSQKKQSNLLTFSKGKSFSGYVIDNKKSMLSTTSKMKSLISKGIIEEYGSKSKCWLGVPLMVDKKAIGVMGVTSRTNENAFNQHDLDLLELIAFNISKTIKQARDLGKINLLNQVLIQSPAIVLITNIEGELEYANPSFTTITGYKPDEMLGKNPKLLIAGNKRKYIIESLKDPFSKGKYWQGEFDNIKKDGTLFRVFAIISPVKNEKGIVTNYVAVIEDITEKSKLERQFINAIVEAQEIEKQSFGEELHDGISQMLSAEGMYINLLIEMNQDRINDKAKFLTKIKEINNNAVNEARNISHGLMSYQLKRNGLIEAIKNICTDFNNTKNITFSFIKKGIKEDEFSDEIKTNLFRVIQEISTNIVRHSSAKKASIKLTKLKGNTIKLIVEDNGIGIDFNKLQSENKGAGIKNLERRIIYINGTLDVKSVKNKGTRYTIKVPLI